MIQEKIDNIDNDNTEIPLSLVDLILHDPVYTFLIGVIFGLILSYIFRKLFSTKNTLPNVELKKEPIDSEGNFGDLFQNIGNSDKCKDLYKSLMIKVQTQADQIKDLTNEKNSLVTACNKGINQVYTLEKIIATGDVKMSNFSKQLARSLQDQEARIMKEAELKKELNYTRLELNKLRQ